MPEESLLDSAQISNSECNNRPEDTECERSRAGCVFTGTVDEDVDVVKREWRDEIGKEPRTHITDTNTSTH